MNKKMSPTTYRTGIFTLLLTPIFLCASFTPLVSPSNTNWKVYQLESLEATMQSRGVQSYRFLNFPTMQASLFELNESGQTMKRRSSSDQVVYVLEGKARVAVGEASLRLSAGQVFYLRAGRHLEIAGDEDELLFLLVKAKAPEHSNADQKTAPFKQFPAPGFPPKELDRSTWVPLLYRPTLRAGWYRLPESENRDNTISRHRDAFHLLVRGKAELELQGSTTELTKGSMIYVPAETNYTFRNVSEAADILVLLGE